MVIISYTNDEAERIQIAVRKSLARIDDETNRVSASRRTYAEKVKLINALRSEFNDLQMAADAIAAVTKS